MNTKWILLIGIFFTIVFSCKKETTASIESQPDAGSFPVLNLPDSLYNYMNLNLPPHVENNTQLAVYAFENEPGNNPISNEGATLGRVLFFDRRLSEDNSVSCASCHSQEKGFARNEVFSTGINGHVTKRNSMSLINMRYFQDFFWDMTADGLEDQVLKPIQDELEMNSDLGELISELSADEDYLSLFYSAFDDSLITAERISLALSQFIRSIVSFESKYDQGFSIGFSNFSEIELDGKDLFFSGDFKCNQCHSNLNFFTRLEPAMNGLELEEWDTGFYNATGNEEHIGMFKIVSLRNIEVSAPYMHDGRFASLEEVIEHYNSGMVSHPNLDARLTIENEEGGTPIDFNMTEYEKAALVAFLKTLTDNQVLSDERFSDPFVY